MRNTKRIMYDYSQNAWLLAVTVSLRPDLYCLGHDRRVVVPIEFTVADDANLSAAIGRKHAKYDPWLLQNPCASIARLVPGARDPHS